ncbi:MAG: patatin-like phospholipase family protein [Planctomycetes bacterium]|nr:patatin-like phospholipase family protein [Planctomycetota bacterium]
MNILVLSGGGQYASFAGGILTGWTDTGKRPNFDVVTGVSSGAFLAVYAYLGPKYDSRIKRMAHELKMSDVFVYRPIYYLMRQQSIGSSEPLQKLIESEVNDEAMEDMRAAHRSGRRLFIGTMNQRTRRLVIWDLGAIACSDQPNANQLVRKILVASSSIPGVVPPVKIDVEVNGAHYTEEHVDGGAVSLAFVRFGPEFPQPDPAKPDAKWLAGSNLYAIAGGKLYADTHEGGMGLLSRTICSISGTLYALYRADLWRIYSLCTASGIKFHHTGVPDDTKISFNSTTFDGNTMKELYNLGHRLGSSDVHWRTTPPGCESGEEESPRAGFRFTIP